MAGEQVRRQRRQGFADAPALDLPALEISLRRLEVRVPRRPLDDDWRVAANGHVYEPGVAQVVERDRLVARVALDVEGGARRSNGLQVLA